MSNRLPTRESELMVLHGMLESDPINNPARFVDSIVKVLRICEIPEEMLAERFPNTTLHEVVLWQRSECLPPESEWAGMTSILMDILAEEIKKIWFEQGH